MKYIAADCLLVAWALVAFILALPVLLFVALSVMVSKRIRRLVG